MGYLEVKVMAKKFKPLFGVQSKTWLRIDAASTVLFAFVTGKKALNMIGEHGIFGVGKSKTLEGLSLGMNKQGWTHLDTTSTILMGLVLLHGAIDAVEEVKKLPNEEQLLPGKGVVYSSYEWTSNIF